MLLLSPPDASSGRDWQRDLVPERGSARRVVLIADTSGSMDPAARDVAGRNSSAALLALLGTERSFSTR